MRNREAPPCQIKPGCRIAPPALKQVTDLLKSVDECGQDDNIKQAFKAALTAMSIAECFPVVENLNATKQEMDRLFKLHYLGDANANRSN